MTRYAVPKQKTFLEASEFNTAPLLNKSDLSKPLNPSPPTSNPSDTDLPRKKQKRNPDRKRACFNCKKKGHSMALCPLLSKNENQTATSSVKNNKSTICFRCGSLQHSLKACPQKKDPSNLLPYATCFVCLEKGHLASQCSQKETSTQTAPSKETTHPDISSSSALVSSTPPSQECQYCGSEKHFSQDCNPTVQGKTIGKITVNKLSAFQSTDDDDVFLALQRMEKQNALTKKTKRQNVHIPVTPKKKVVFF